MTKPNDIANAQDGWDGLLVDGEEILWQGTPDGRIFWRDLIAPETLFGVFFTGFAVFWISIARWMTASGPDSGSTFDFFPLFGVPFVLIGLYVIIGRIFVDAYVRRRTHYTLTTHNAFVATSTFGRRNLFNYPHNTDQQITLDDSTPGSVWFAIEVVPVSTSHSVNGRNRRTTGYTRKKIGFRRIENARKVYAAMRRAVHELNQAQAQNNETSK